MNVWYLSKYLEVPSLQSSGGRSYKLMRYVALAGHSISFITSTANHLNEVPNITRVFSIHQQDDLNILWIKTLRFKAPKSILRMLGWLDFEFKVLFASYHLRQKPDVVIVSSPSIFSLLNGLVLKYRFKAKLIFEIRDIWPLTLVEEGGFSSFNPFIRLIGLIEKLGYLKADAIIGTMPGLNLHVETVLKEPRLTLCIPMGFHDQDEKTDRRLPDNFICEHVPEDKFLIFYAGTLGITNALDTLFLSAERLQDEKDIHFLIVGKGGETDNLIRKYGNLKNVSFVPPVPKFYIQNLLSFADVCYFGTFHSKVWDYGQSLAKVVEYMRAGKPVIGSYSGMKSMLNEAECGVFVEAENPECLAETILEFRDMEPKIRIDMGKNGQTWLKYHRNYSNLGNNYLKLIESL